jgi:hypothetical protein
MGSEELEIYLEKLEAAIDTMQVNMSKLRARLLKDSPQVGYEAERQAVIEELKEKLVPKG